MLHAVKQIAVDFNSRIRHLPFGIAPILKGNKLVREGGQIGMPVNLSTTYITCEETARLFVRELESENVNIEKVYVGTFDFPIYSDQELAHQVDELRHVMTMVVDDKGQDVSLFGFTFQDRALIGSRVYCDLGGGGPLMLLMDYAQGMMTGNQAKTVLGDGTQCVIYHEADPIGLRLAQGQRRLGLRPVRGEYVDGKLLTSFVGLHPDWMGTFAVGLAVHLVEPSALRLGSFLELGQIEFVVGLNQSLAAKIIERSEMVSESFADFYGWLSEERYLKTPLKDARRFFPKSAVYARDLMRREFNVVLPSFFDLIKSIPKEMLP
jgi:hypothetical protein